jgi:hypothetical protein
MLVQHGTYTNIKHCIKFVPQNSRPLYCCNCNHIKSEHSQPIFESLPQLGSKPNNNNNNNNENVHQQQQQQQQRKYSNLNGITIKINNISMEEGESLPHNFIYEQQMSGQMANASAFLSQVLLYDLLKAISLPEGAAKELYEQIKQREEKPTHPQILLTETELYFLQEEILKVQAFIKEQKCLNRIVKIQSVARRYLVCKHFKHNLQSTTISSCKKKNEHIMDLLRTEREYIKHLQTLITNFVLPLRQVDCIAPQEAASIFSNVESISELHSHLYSRLSATIETNFPFIDGIGKIFLDIHHMMKAYYVYMNNFKNAINELDRLYAENPRFANFIQDVSGSPLSK